MKYTVIERKFHEIEETLADSEKGMQVFKQLLNKEALLRKKELVKNTLCIIQLILLVVMCVLYFTDIISILGTAGIMFLQFLLAIANIAMMLHGNNEIIPSEISFINGLLKDKGECEEVEVIPSNKQSYIEVQTENGTQLICIDDGRSSHKIESCIVCYFKEISRLYNSIHPILIREKYRIFVKYEEQAEPEIIIEK
ncbi:MAG: hypothetical protein ACLUCI_03820 [Blautia hansenii]